MPRLLLLPATTAPADAALVRRHDPRSVQKDYHVFRACLRWEFGFTCAICLLHELDWMPYGAEGAGVTQIEHLIPRSADDALVGVYANVLYICRFCNGARSDTDQQDEQGRHLLDPTQDVWSAHFRVENDELRPFAGDVHAEYTAEVYNVNDPRKVKLRRRRREWTEDWWAGVQANREQIAKLTRRAKAAKAATKAALLRDIAHARESLERQYRLRPGTWEPEDAPEHCRCGKDHARTLPAPYLRQVVEIEVP